MSLRPRTEHQETGLRYGALNGPAIGLKPGVVLPSVKRDAPYLKSVPTEDILTWKEAQQNLQDRAKAAQRGAKAVTRDWTERSRLSEAARKILNLIQDQATYFSFPPEKRAELRAEFAEEVIKQGLIPTWFGFVEEEQIIDLLKNRMQLVAPYSAPYFEYAILVMLTEQAYKIVEQINARANDEQLQRIARADHEAAKRVQKTREKEEMEANGRLAARDLIIDRLKRNMAESAKGTDGEQASASSGTQRDANDGDGAFDRALEEVQSIRDRWMKKLAEQAKRQTALEKKRAEDAEAAERDNWAKYYAAREAAEAESEQTEENDDDWGEQPCDNPSAPGCKTSVYDAKKMGEKLKNLGWNIAKDDKTGYEYYFDANGHTVPRPWKPQLDKSNYLYFVNMETGETLPPGWVPQYDDQLRLWWYYDYYDVSVSQYETPKTLSPSLANKQKGFESASGKSVAVVLRPGKIGGPMRPPNASIR